MATPGRARSALATVIGYVIVGIVVWYLLRFLLGTIFWLVRTFLLLFVLFALIVLYFKLKTPKNKSTT